MSADEEAIADGECGGPVDLFVEGEGDEGDWGGGAALGRFWGCGRFAVEETAAIAAEEDVGGVDVGDPPDEDAFGGGGGVGEGVADDDAGGVGGGGLDGGIGVGAGD